jgi:hypothetical protein
VSDAVEGSEGVVNVVGSSSVYEYESSADSEEGWGAAVAADIFWGGGMLRAPGDGEQGSRSSV